MSTDAQINANRLNAQKSTGPKSPEGKAASSLNALKSGVDACSHMIPGEDPTELEALTAAFLLHFHPSDSNQLALVDTLISTEWIQRRLRRIEAQLWNHQTECLDDSFQQSTFLGHAYQNGIDPFTRIPRRIDATNRMYLRTLKALQDLQSAPSKPVSEPPSPLPNQPLTPQIGFVPQSAPAPDETPLAIHSGPRQIPNPIPKSHSRPSIPAKIQSCRAPAPTPNSPSSDSSSSLCWASLPAAT